MRSAPTMRNEKRINCTYLARRLLDVPELEDDGDEEAGDEAGEGQRQADLAEQAERQHEPHLHRTVRRRGRAGGGGRGLAAVVGGVRRRYRDLLRILGGAGRMRITLTPLFIVSFPIHSNGLYTKCHEGNFFRHV